MMLSKERQQTAFDVLSGTFGYTSRMAAPRVVKVVVSSGTGKKRDAKQLELIADRLAHITGQKPSSRSAKQSIASFKVREGDPVGFSITLRGARMFDFLDKLIHVALPRTRDFRGIPRTAIDAMGNITIGIREHTIFPETADEDLKDVFGLAVTVVTTARTREEAEAFFRHLGFPLRVDGDAKR
ncbi:MAG: 50S ribosomal protein L5 [Parcubacteria group bacterium 21-54-25]|nr:MAG: 50S ribosomal protein L5 [Parcubacteria group bacterium 21-54-25]HQU08257.1 50S ribosomal protein L5 [Candidatus Paceibacterota bacterium]